LSSWNVGAASTRLKGKRRLVGVSYKTEQDSYGEDSWREMAIAIDLILSFVLLMCVMLVGR